MINNTNWPLSVLPLSLQVIILSYEKVIPARNLVKGLSLNELEKGLAKDWSSKLDYNGPLLKDLDALDDLTSEVDLTKLDERIQCIYNMILVNQVISTRAEDNMVPIAIRYLIDPQELMAEKESLQKKELLRYLPDVPEGLKEPIRFCLLQSN